ncbi:MAG: ABC transporter permease, partial [Pseudomonadaceae bacterium]
MKSTISSKGWALLCLVPFALFFFAFQIAPLAWVASNSLNTAEGWGLGYFQLAISSAFYLQAMRPSLEV